MDNWDEGEGIGAPGIGCKKPYGNSDIVGDVARILDAPDEDWVFEDGHKAYVTDEAEERFTRVHVETMVALQIVLATGQFHPGHYRRHGWGNDWRLDDSNQ